MMIYTDFKCDFCRYIHCSGFYTLSTCIGIFYILIVHLLVFAVITVTSLETIFSRVNKAISQGSGITK